MMLKYSTQRLVVFGEHDVGIGISMTDPLMEIEYEHVGVCNKVRRDN